MRTNLALRIGRWLMAISLYLLFTSLTIYAQRPVRIGINGPTVMVQAAAPCSNPGQPDDGVTIDLACCQSANRTTTGCFGNVMRLATGDTNDYWIEAIHSALMPQGSIGDPANILGYVIMWEYGTYNTTSPPCTNPPGPPCTILNTKLWNALCRYVVGVDPSSSTCFTAITPPLQINDQLNDPTNPPPGGNKPTATIFCAGHSFLDDGKLLVTGGDHLRNTIPGKYGMAQGPRITHTFDALTGGQPLWTKVANLNHPARCEPGLAPTNADFDCNNQATRSGAGYDCTKACVNGGRYYPTNISMKLGTAYSVLSFSGYAQRIFPNAESFTTPRASDFRNYTNEVYSAGSWTRKHSLYGFIDTFPGITFPRLHLFPSTTGDGKIFYVSYNEPYSYLYDPTKTEDQLNLMWTKRYRPKYYRADGSSVLLPLAVDGTGQLTGDIRVLSVAGCNKSKEPCEILANGERYSNTSDNWSLTDMKDSYPNGALVPRQHSNAALLPDGKVVVLEGESVSGCDPYPESSPRVCPPPPGQTGTACIPVYSGQLFDPTVTDPSNPWTFIPAHSQTANQRARQYHSTALLLQDGTVQLAGGDTDRFCNCPAGLTDNCPSAQLYFPPYMFRGTRPAIVATGPG